MHFEDALTLTIEQIPLGSPRLKLFVDFPWSLNKNDSFWTPPLRGDLLGNRLLGLKGLLTPGHPYHRHAEVTHFIARRGNKIVGRVSAAVNERFNNHYQQRFGFFGFFEVVEDYEAAEALLDAARDWTASRGMDVLRGPGEYSNATHERQGVLIDGYDSPPTVDLTHNPPYYASFLERYGFAKAKDYYAHIIEGDFEIPPRLKKLADRVRRRRDIKTRALNFNELISEVRLIVKIYNEAWAHNWGFLPITEAEADSMADSLKLVVDPGLVRFAFVNDEPAAVLGAFPDPNYCLKPGRHWRGSDIPRVGRLLLGKKRIPRVRLMFFGIRPGFRKLGIDALLFDEFRDYFMSHKYRSCEASMLLEDNHLILSPTEFMGARRYKTWRIYDLPLIRKS